MKNLTNVSVAVVMAISMAGCASTSGNKLVTNNQAAVDNAQREVDEIVCKDAGGDWDNIKGYCTN